MTGKPSSTGLYLDPLYWLSVSARTVFFTARPSRPISTPRRESFRIIVDGSRAVGLCKMIHDQQPGHACLAVT